MNATWAIIAKDLRRTRRHVSIVVAAIVGQWLLGLNELLWSPVDVGLFFKLVTGLKLVQFTLTFYVAALVISEDPLVGTKAFWLTRPISRRRLLIAKVTAVMLATVAIPVLAFAPWWIAYSMPGRILGWAILETVAEQFLVALAVAVVATLTDRLGRTLVWSVVLAAAIVLGPLGMSVMEVAIITGPVGWTVVLAELAVLAAMGVIVVLLQYLGRNRVVGIVLLGVGFLAAGVVGSRWQRSHQFATGIPRGVANAELGQGVTLEATGSTLDFGADPTDVAAEKLYFRYRGLPMGLVLEGDLAELTLRWPSGLETHLWNWLRFENGRYANIRGALAVCEPSPDPETMAWEQQRMNAMKARSAAWRAQHSSEWLKPHADVRGHVMQNDEGELDLMLKKGIAAQIPIQHPSYTMSAMLHLKRPVLSLELPLVVSSAALRHGFGVRIADVDERRQRDLSLWPRVGFGALFAEPKLFRDEVVKGQRPHWPDWRSLYLVDRSTGYVERMSGPNFDSVPFTVIGCVGFRIISGMASVPMWRRGDYWVPQDPQFLDHASVALVDLEEVARVERSVTVEHWQPDVIGESAPGEAPVPPAASR